MKQKITDSPRNKEAVRDDEGRRSLCHPLPARSAGGQGGDVCPTGEGRPAASDPAVLGLQRSDRAARSRHAALQADCEAPAAHAACTSSTRRGTTASASARTSSIVSLPSSWRGWPMATKSKSKSAAAAAAGVVAEQPELPAEVVGYGRGEVASTSAASVRATSTPAPVRRSSSSTAHRWAPSDGASSGKTWALNFPVLKAGYNVIAYDKLGQGFTDNPKTDADYTMHATVQHAIAFLEKLGKGPYHIVGHSRGGFVVSRLALERPDLVKSCVCVSSGSLSPGQSRTHLVFRDPPQPQLTRESIRWYLRALLIQPEDRDRGLARRQPRDRGDRERNKIAVREDERGGLCEEGSSCRSSSSRRPRRTAGCSSAACPARRWWCGATTIPPPTSTTACS